MNRKTGFLTSFLIVLAFMLGSVQEVQAKRMGGGTSFGSKPSYNQPFQPQSTPNSSIQPTRSLSQQQASIQNQSARQSYANRGGLMGMLGGLALGGLLGSLFFGGAFENFNFMDILLLIGIAYLLYRLVAARFARKNQPIAKAYGRDNYSEVTGGNGYHSTGQPAFNSVGFETNLLFNKDKITTDETIPSGFDKQAFLTGAERAYRYLQASWDNRDLTAIRGLTTDKVFAEIQDQLRESSIENKTKVLKVDAELLEVREIGTDLEAAVLFDTLMCENDGENEQIREVWHFIKPINSQQSKWFLDGIQQLQG